VPRNSKKKEREIARPGMHAGSVRDLRRPGTRGKRRSAASAHAHGREETVRTVSHPRFGAIPLIRVTRVDAEGGSYELNDYDPDYAPPLPPGAVRGDVRRQEFCRMCHIPRYFYVDEPKRCVQCGSDFVFGAKEQKHWYEALKFHFDSVAVRCASCRKQRRSELALQQQVVAARAAVDAEPRKPSALLSLAEALARLFERTGRGSMKDGIAASRAARREAAKAHDAAEVAESLFWEATCQRLAGHVERSRPLYEAFLAATPGGRNKALAQEARRVIGLR
jgi:hypothetical protein